MKDLLLTYIVVTLFGCSQNNQSTNEDNEKKVFREIQENTIINLYDAFGEPIAGVTKDFGFSCIVKYTGKTILFDGGTNADIFQSNVEALNIDLSNIDYVIASHPHFDHINGFDYLLKVNPGVKIYFPFDLFWGANNSFNLAGMDSTVADSLEKRMQYFDGEYTEYTFNQTGRFWNANIEFIKENTEIAPGMKLITSSSTNMGYFNKYPSLDGCENCESHATRFNGLKELSLSLETNEGEVLFVGCSHSTVEKIVVEAKVYAQNNIAMVYGGYHLLPYDRPTLIDLASRLKNEHKVKKVAPAHCTGHLAFKILQEKFEEDYVFAGLGEEVKF